jgi:DNA-directed RNA polymerase specialized sigma24 family protein
VVDGVTDHDVHLRAIVGGDTVAFGRWMSATERTVRDSLRSFAAAVDVESVLQESLLRIWQVAPRFEPDGRPNGLLRLAIRIARNLAVSEVRRTRAVPVRDDDLDAALAAADRATSAPDPMLRKAIAVCRENLPAKPREALDARLASHGMRGDDDLAEALGMRLNTFLQNVTRARQLLAECLRKKGVPIEELA